MEVYTIGFTKRSAADFFGTLKSRGIRQLIDIRLNNSSQLAAFAKRDDLAFFLRAICDASYRHELLLAPTAEILAAYRNKSITWDEYESRFCCLLEERQVERCINPALFNTPSVLLCSEARPDKCHRRLVVEYLADKWGGVEAIHL
jgi:uncharacterized protein (DUF488 family)